MFIDTHCHLNFSQYDQDRAMVIGNAKKAGVKTFINPGVNLHSSRESIALSKQYPGVVFAAVGIHPHEAQHDPDPQKLERLLPGVVAIGECGLDYFQFKGEQALGKKDKQRRLFDEQLRLAITHNLPVIMHCRDAYEDFFDVLDTLPQRPQGVIHCFSGGLQDLRMAEARKFFVGIDGNATYSKHLWSIVPSIPLSMLLLETDSPFLSPVPHRGERNEPKYIPLIAKKIAELQHKDIRDIEEATANNAQKLFAFV
ncbi:TatD family hydrolase [Candidatus Gottesmanbacteria bacterium]|nr:TatD family hydrolase [Candidatus Gottesmanbacteria bacterium]